MAHSYDPELAERSAGILRRRRRIPSTVAEVEQGERERVLPPGVRGESLFVTPPSRRHAYEIERERAEEERQARLQAILPQLIPGRDIPLPQPVEAQRGRMGLRKRQQVPGIDTPYSQEVEEQRTRMGRRIPPLLPGRDIPYPSGVEEQRGRMNEPREIAGRDIPLPPDVEQQRIRMRSEFLFGPELPESPSVDLESLPPTQEVREIGGQGQRRWSRSGWLRANPGGDIAAAEAEARRQGATVVD